MKPVVCVILPIKKKSTKFVRETLEEFNKYFTSSGFDTSFVPINCFTLNLAPEEFSGMHSFNLSPRHLYLGTRLLLGRMEDNILIPTVKEGVFEPLPTEMYHYLKEYVEILYNGCENKQDLEEMEEDEQEDFKREHLESFIGGNPISFESLSFGHDVRREDSTKICSYIERLLFGSLDKSMIVQILHPPGSGGSTIARRVLWDLHLIFPCIIAKLSSWELDNDLAKDAFVSNLADRIGTLSEVCGAAPVILLDGNTSLVKTVSDKLVKKLRTFDRKALVFRCLHMIETNVAQFDHDPYVNQSFKLSAKLEDYPADLEAFKTQYKKILEDSRQLNVSKRVYHFPLLAMMGEFEDILRQIIYDSMDIIKHTSSFEYEVVLFIAFILIYAGKETPASLILKAFSKQLPNLIQDDEFSVVTYEDLARCFSCNFLNLTVHKRARSGKQRKRSVSPTDAERVEYYTVQHVKVAQLVLEYADRSLFDLTNAFLSYPIYDLRSNDREDHLLKTLISDIFVYYGREKVSDFSLLTEKLDTVAPSLAADIFQQLAKKTEDPIYYCNAAKYLTNRRHDFGEAKRLLGEAFDINVSRSLDKERKLHETLGNTLLQELRVTIHKIKDIEELERVAANVLENFEKGKDFPLTLPYPLLGQVKVWIECYNWVSKNKDGGMNYVKNERKFFSTSGGDCFDLLDIVDKLISESETITDIEVTGKSVNDCRLNLLKIFGWAEKESKKSLRSQDMSHKEKCEMLCTSENFKQASSKEILRLKLACLSDFGTKNVEHMHEHDQHYAMEILHKLVVELKEYRYVSKWLKLAALTSQMSYSVDEVLATVNQWSEKEPHDPQVLFYQYILYFLKMLETDNVTEYKSKVELALKICGKRSSNNPRRPIQQFYLSLKNKETDNELSQLITLSELEKQSGKNLGGPSESNLVKDITVADDPKLGSCEFWKEDSRKYLTECSGRIYVPRGKTGQPYIEYSQGSIPILVPKDEDVGKVHIDYDNGQSVYFVLGFSFAGLCANGISPNPFHTDSEDKSTACYLKI